MMKQDTSGGAGGNGCGKTRGARIAAGVWLLGCALGLAAAEPPAPGGQAVAPVVPMGAVPFELSSVRLLESPFQEAMERNRDYLLGVDPDRLLHMFRVTAGLPSAAEPLGGWEAPGVELRGHTLGHYLSACALMFASTGEERLRAKAEYLVGELAKCQAALPARGYHRGYLSAFPESFLDRVDARQPVWAPWYTLHKILAGLLDVHVHTGNGQALEVLLRQAGWVKFRVDRLTPEQMQRSLEMEFGGMNEVLANLHAVTGDPEHLRLARAFDHQAIFGPLARHEDRLDGLHANTQVPKIIGAAREFELSGEAAYREIAQFFWERVALARSYVIGGHSDSEHFFPTNSFARHLSPATCETCNTYNMLKLTRHVFAWDPSATAMDFYERALYNHILPSQDPETGMFIYFAALKPGHFKTYSKPLDSFWCCFGTGMENHARYGEAIYSHHRDTLWVNLFIPSVLTWPARDVSVRLETRFPEEDVVRLRIVTAPKGGVRCIKLRQPHWVGAGMTVSVNGRVLPGLPVSAGYVAIEREWQAGDQVEVRLPMQLAVESLPDDPDCVAFLHGPLVLAGELGREGLEAISPYAKGQLDYAHVPAVTPPALVGERAKLLEAIQPVPDRPLTFRTAGLGRPAEVQLIPYYRLHHQRYTVYWKVLSEAGWQAQQEQLAAEAARLRELERRSVDVVRPGEQQPETDHQFQGEQSRSGVFQDRRWRDAAEGGWFSYRVKVLPDQPVILACEYWGSDGGARVFDVLVEGEKVATQRLNQKRPGEFFQEEYPVPPSLTEGRQAVTVRFQAHPGQMAGGLFGLRVLRAR